MTFRRLALALALLSAPVDADDFDDFISTDTDTDTAELLFSHRKQGEKGVLTDLLVHQDGSIDVAVTKRSETEWYVPWGLVRLALADVEGTADEGHEPLWIPMLTDQHAAIESIDRYTHAESFSLNSLGGQAVVGPHGETIGVVRGSLVSWERGRVLALAVDVGAFLGTQSRIIAVPWNWFHAPMEAHSSLALSAEADLNWIRWANEVDLKQSM